MVPFEKFNIQTYIHTYFKYNTIIQIYASFFFKMSPSELDYYNILSVHRNATKEDILISYRKLAARLFPLRNDSHMCDFDLLNNDDKRTHMAPIPLSRQWAYINMACDVLCKSKKYHLYVGLQ